MKKPVLGGVSLKRAQMQIFSKTEFLSGSWGTAVGQLGDSDRNFGPGQLGDSDRNFGPGQFLIMVTVPESALFNYGHCPGICRKPGHRWKA